MLTERIMNESLDLEFTKMHYETTDEVKKVATDEILATTVIQNDVAIASTSIAKSHPNSNIINSKRIPKPRFR